MLYSLLASQGQTAQSLKELAEKNEKLRNRLDKAAAKFAFVDIPYPPAAPIASSTQAGASSSRTIPQTATFIVILDLMETMKIELKEFLRESMSRFRSIDDVVNIQRLSLFSAAQLPANFKMPKFQTLTGVLMIKCSSHIYHNL